MKQVKDIGGASVSITTLDSLKKAASPWHDIVNQSEDDEEDEDEEEVTGMSLKQKKEAEVVPFKVGDKARKAINRCGLRIFSKFTFLAFSPTMIYSGIIKHQINGIFDMIWSFHIEHLHKVDN